MLNKKFDAYRICDGCAKCNHVNSSFKPKNVIRTYRPFDLTHMDLCGPTHVHNRSGYYYVFAIVDDYSHFTWTIFLKFKNGTFNEFENLVKQVQNKINLQMATIRYDHGSKFDNGSFIEYCRDHGVSHNFQHLDFHNKMEEMARIMLLESGLPIAFLAKAVSMACYILNRVILRPVLKKTPYKLLRGRKHITLCIKKSLSLNVICIIMGKIILINLILEVMKLCLLGTPIHSQ